MLVAFAPPVTAHAAGYTVKVAVDQAAYEAREITFRFDRLKFLINAALRGDGSSINVVGGDSEASAYVTDLTSNASFIDDVRRRFAGDPRYNFTYTPTETLQITYSSEARKKFEPPTGEPAVQTKFRLFTKSLPRDLSALQTSVRFLRDPLPGIQVESVSGATIVHSQNPAFGDEMESALKDRLGSAFKVTPLDANTWRFDLDPSVPRNMGPGQSLEMQLVLPELLRTELRDPLDLETQITEAGVKATVAEPERHEAFVERLKQTFGGSADFVLSSEPSAIVRIALRKRPSDATSEPSFQVMEDLEEVASPPIVMTIGGGELGVRAKDPSKNADRAARIRRALAAEPDVAISAAADQSIAIRFTSPVPAATPVGVERLMKAVHSRLNALKLSNVKLDAIAPDEIDIAFLRSDDAKSFAHDIANSFAIRLVDGETTGAAKSPPSPGDQTFPQEAGGHLWLNPVSIIGDGMVAFASAGTDENGMPDVKFRLTDEGRQRFAAATGANVGRTFAILVDGVVVSAPRMIAPITGGEGQITGNFTVEAAQSLAASLMAHRDDLPLRVID